MALPPCMTFQKDNENMATKAMMIYIYRNVLKLGFKMKYDTKDYKLIKLWFETNTYIYCEDIVLYDGKFMGYFEWMSQYVG
jgi:hypothetical protein